MPEKPLEYKKFIDDLCDTGEVDYDSKSDLEEFTSTIEIYKQENNQELANLYKIIGPVFNSLTEEQKNAFGKWNEYNVRYGIADCLQKIKLNNAIHLALDQKLLKFDYAKDFWERCKTDGLPYGEWEIK